MHELSLTQSVVSAIAEKLGDARIACVRLEIGKLSGVVVESIRFCFDLVAEGTTLDGARLEISEPSGSCVCRESSDEFTVDDPIVLSGCDLLIKSVEVIPACAPPVAAP
jgi:hydrogenase nickel incorporation protein HypA/HybF